MSQEQNQNQQVLDALTNTKSFLEQQNVTNKIADATSGAIGLIILLTAITIVRFFIRRKRLANLL